MNQLLEKNKIPLTIIVAALIIAASIWLSKRPPSVVPQIAQSPQQSSKSAQPLQSSSTRISFLQAPDYIGKSVCVTGKVDHVYTSQKGTIFINFCPDYKIYPPLAWFTRLRRFHIQSSTFSVSPQSTGRLRRTSGVSHP